jgi:hypothetical protein
MIHKTFTVSDYECIMKNKWIYEEKYNDYLHEARHRNLVFGRKTHWIEAFTDNEGSMVLDEETDEWWRLSPFSAEEFKGHVQNSEKKAAEFWLIGDDFIRLYDRFGQEIPRVSPSIGLVGSQKTRFPVDNDAGEPPGIGNLRFVSLSPDYSSEVNCKVTRVA